MIASSELTAYVSSCTIKVTVKLTGKLSYVIPPQIAKLVFTHALYAVPIQRLIVN